MATHPGTGKSLQPLTCKTWVLKVSIHCEGCKKKVKKILHSVEGVYGTDIDTKLQKVIVTGNIEAETLINKLVKSGKNAELWPELVLKKEKKSGKMKKREKQNEPQISTHAQPQGHIEPEKEKSSVKVDKLEENSKKTDDNSVQGPKVGENSCKATKIAQGVAKKVDDGEAVKIVEGVAKKGDGGEAIEPKSEEKKLETDPAGNRSPAKTVSASNQSHLAEKKANESGDEPSCNVKKKKKGKKSSNEGGPLNNIATASIESTQDKEILFRENPIPPRHHGYEYPPYYHAPPLVCAVSYNTAHPSSSYTASYYASPPPYSHTYAYAHPGMEMQPPPPDVDSYPRQPLDSFELFSDENPNGCSIM